MAAKFVAMLGLISLVVPFGAPAATASTYSCKTLSWNVCQYAIVRPDGSRLAFALRPGAERSLDENAAGPDHYMLTLNAPPPADFKSCDTRRYHARRGDWCMTGWSR